MKVINSVGNDLKSFDLKSWFQITIVIFWFWFKITWKQWSVILILNHFWLILNLIWCFGKKITLQYISFVTVNLRQCRTLVRPSDCCWWITPSCSCKSYQSGSTELRWWQRKDLQILSGYPNVCATFLKCNTSCRARHQSSAFSALEG